MFMGSGVLFFLQYERRSNLSRFEGSSAISSADYFGSGTARPTARSSSSASAAAYNIQVNTIFFYLSV